MLDLLDLERIGAFRDARSGLLMRHRVRSTNFQYDPDDPQAVLKGALLAYDEQLVPHPVILPLATDEASVREAQQKAIDAGADFYHPQHGWLRWGRKRETERPENLGAGSARYETRRVVLTNGTEGREYGVLPGGAPPVFDGPLHVGAAPAASDHDDAAGTAPATKGASRS